MAQPEQLMSPSTNFTYKNRATGHSTANPLVTPGDYSSVAALDARLAALSLGKLATAIASGSTTTVVIANSEAFRVPNGSLIEIRTSADALKSSGGGKTVTGVAADTPQVGQTTVTFTTAAAGATAAGDYIALTTKPYGGSYPASFINSMTVNDKIFAVRKADDSDTF